MSFRESELFSSCYLERMNVMFSPSLSIELSSGLGVGNVDAFDTVVVKNIINICLLPALPSRL